MKDTIFISHATPTDNIFATWLATKLELCGYKVWVDLMILLHPLILEYYRPNNSQ